MEHVDYARWADYLFLLWNMHGHAPVKVLELACGTGTLLRELHYRGLRCTGLDKSMPMLRIAREKLRTGSAPSCLIQADMGALPLGAGFDTVICLYDSLNYLPSLDHLSGAVGSVLTHLVPGGVFIFDICTEYNSQKHFNGRRDAGAIGDFHYRRHSVYRSKERLQINDFVITGKSAGEVWKERHRQTIFRIRDVYEVVKSLPLARIAQYKDYTTAPPDSATKRVHFYLVKE